MSKHWQVFLQRRYVNSQQEYKQTHKTTDNQSNANQSHNEPHPPGCLQCKGETVSVGEDEEWKPYTLPEGL